MSFQERTNESTTRKGYNTIFNRWIPFESLMYIQES